MKNLIISLFKLNLLFCAGVVVLDTYGKICEIHKATKATNSILHKAV